MRVAVSGAGAFGTALAISLAQANASITLLARNSVTADQIRTTRLNPRLPEIALPENIAVSADHAVLGDISIVLLAIPAQKLGMYLNEHSSTLAGKHLVACCKGIDLTTLKGPTGTISDAVKDAKPAMLTCPSFAHDIARGLPTALTLATQSELDGEILQHDLTTQNIRIYRTTDTVGAELGGALKNVIAIGAGVAIGSGFGDSARAALMTRGFSEMMRLSDAIGANPTTLTGLSGFGDLALTCTSELSRNYCHGLSIGRNETPDASKTIEGAATALAVRKLAKKHQLDLPVCDIVADLCEGKTTPRDALALLLSRPLKEE